MQRMDIGRRNRLIANFTAALDLLEAQGREPDRWEEECLSYALGALACDMVLVAEVELDAFYRSMHERSPAALAALNARPARFTRAMLRHGLDYVLSRRDAPMSADDLPVGVGFGIRTPEQAAAVARHADAAVVGSAIVDRVKAGLDANGKAKPGLVAGVLADVKALAGGVRSVVKG